MGYYTCSGEYVEDRGEAMQRAAREAQEKEARERAEDSAARQSEAKRPRGVHRRP